MASEYDREDGGGAFLMGLLAGTVLGAGLGMLFAPKAGSELRNDLTESAKGWQRSAADTYQEASQKVSQIVERGREAYGEAVEKGREIYDRARGAASQVGEEAQRFGTDTPRYGTPTPPMGEGYGG